MRPVSTPVCRVCRCAEVANLGTLPDVGYFAGRALAVPLPGGVLYRCRSCYFVFRHPVLNDSDYAQLYRQAGAEVWVSQPRRADFELIWRYLSGLDGSRGADVLDVGCYTGQLLASLPQGYGKYGVEPSAAAARLASEQGVVIVADTVQRLATLSRQFDVITACDVIEHLADPVAFLSTLRDRLRDCGRIVLTTGNADAWLWKLAGSRYWYCYHPEHISFVGSRSLAAVAARSGLCVTERIAFNYAGRGGLSRINALLGALLYAASPAACQAVLRQVRGAAAAFVPPGCGASRDHVLCVLTRGGTAR